MGLFQSNICPKCGAEYSAFRLTCPNCGARRLNPSGRTAAKTDTVRWGTPAQRQQSTSSHWQFIVGLCLVAAVIIAVIVLIVTTLNGNYSTYPTPIPSEAASPSPTLIPSPTPTPTPTPSVESVKVAYYGDPRDGFTLHVGQSIQMGALVYPIDIEGGVTWEVDKPEICTVSDNGLVTAINSGTATLTVRCYGASATCTVWVPDQN